VKNGGEKVKYDRKRGNPEREGVHGVVQVGNGGAKTPPREGKTIQKGAHNVAEVMF